MTICVLGKKLVGLTQTERRTWPHRLQTLCKDSGWIGKKIWRIFQFSTEVIHASLLCFISRGNSVLSRESVNLRDPNFDS